MSEKLEKSTTAKKLDGMPIQVKINGDVFQVSPKDHCKIDIQYKPLETKGDMSLYLGSGNSITCKNAQGLTECVKTDNGEIEILGAQLKCKLLKVLRNNEDIFDPALEELMRDAKADCPLKKHAEEERAKLSKD